MTEQLGSITAKQSSASRKAAKPGVNHVDDIPTQTCRLQPCIASALRLSAEYLGASCWLDQMVFEKT